MTNHYFYDHQGAIVDQWLNTDRRIQKGEFVWIGEPEPAVYLVQGTLHIPTEKQGTDSVNWVVNRMSKLLVNMSHIDTTAPRTPLPLKSVQAYKEK